MSEPSTAAAVTAVPLITVFISLLGPQLGPYAMVFMGAVCGSFWAITSAPAMTRWKAAGMALRVILLSILLTVALSELLSRTFGCSRPGETISSASWSLYQDGKWQGKLLVPVIDFFFQPWMTEHCRKSWVWQKHLYE